MKKSFLFNVMLLSSVFMFCSDTGPGSGGGGADAGNVRSRAHVGRNPFYPSLSSQSGNTRLPAGLTNNIVSFLAPKDEQILAQTNNVDHDFAYRQKHRFYLALQKCQPMILRGHDSEVNSVAISHDQTRIVSGGNDHTVRMWNTTTGEQLQVLRGHERQVSSVAALADGRIVSGSWGRTVRIWNATTGQHLQVWGHEGWVFSVAVLADGRIISGGEDDTVRVWNATTGEQLQILSGHERQVLSVAVLAGNRIVSGGFDGTIRVWDPTTGRELQVLRGHQGPVHSVAVLADGRIVSGDAPIMPSVGTVRIWNATTGVCEKILRGHENSVLSVAGLAGNRIVSGGRDRTIRIWNATTGEQLQVLRGHEGSVRSVAVLADGRIVSGGSDKTIRIWPTSEYLQRKLDQAERDNLSENQMRALFASDGEGVYEALFPQPRRSIEDYKKAVFAAVDELGRVSKFTEMRPLLKKILEQCFILQGESGVWRLFGGAQESYRLQPQGFVDRDLIKRLLESLLQWQDFQGFRRSIHALGIQKDVPGWIALLQKSLVADSRSQVGQEQPISAAEAARRLQGEAGAEAARENQSSEAGGGSK